MAMRMNGNLQLTVKVICVGGRGVQLQDETETWDKRGTQESMGMTLAVTHGIGVMEPEEATSCSQARTPVDG
jgi:hypothetical protein